MKIYEFYLDGFFAIDCINKSEAERLFDRFSEMEDQKYKLDKEVISAVYHKYYFKSRDKDSRP